MIASAFTKKCRRCGDFSCHSKTGSGRPGPCV